MPTTQINGFAVTHHPTHVHVFDPALQVHHYLRPEVYADLDLQTLGSQERLMAASDFAVKWDDSIIKCPISKKALVEAYLGAAPTEAIPARVLDAVRALNAAVAGV